MAYYLVLTLATLAAVAQCEPPVQGYNYRQPSYQGQGFNQGFDHRNSYVPPSTGYSPPSSSYLPPPSSFGSGSSGYGSGGGYDQGQGHGYDHGHGHENEVPKAYEFGYSVKDAKSGNDYNRRESSDGNVVRGEYRVQLPDGRMQIVTYHADWKTGFHADVRYEGEARYPEPVRHQQPGGYNYNTPADYSGSLTGFQGKGNSYKPSTAYGPPGYH